LATALLLGPDTYLVLNYEYGGLKILAVTVLTLLCSFISISMSLSASRTLGDLLSPASGLGFLSFFFPQSFIYSLTRICPAINVLLVG